MSEGTMQKSEQRAWSSRSLAGKWRHRFFYALIGIFGLKPAKFFLFFVVLGYTLRPSIARRAGHYLKRRFNGSQSSGGPGWRHIFKLYWNFGVVLLERAAAGILGGYSVTPEQNCLEQLNLLLAEGKGLIILSAHVGSWQTALAGLQFGVRVNIVQPRDGLDRDLHVFEHNNGPNRMPARPPNWSNARAASYRFIDPRGSFGGFLDIRAALQKGEIVCLMGDRLMPGEKTTLEGVFLGQKALFPGSAYLLASATGAPAAVIFSRRSGECAAECGLAAVFRVPARVGKRPESLEPYAKTFIAALEDYCQREPYQFFNFHNIWRTEEDNDA